MLQALYLGLVQGGIFALSAVGLVLIFSVAGVVNLAHGETVIFGGLVAVWAASDLDFPYVLAVVTGGVAAAVLGLLIGVAVFDRIRGNFQAHLVASVGLIMLMSALFVKVFGSSPVTLSNRPRGIVEVAGLRMTTAGLLIIVSAILLTFGLHWYITRSRVGRGMRAMAVNPVAAEVVGIPIRRYSVIAFVIASALAGLAGALLASTFPLDPFSGGVLVFQAFVVVLFAGLGSIRGALLGGFLLGIVGTLATTYISSGYTQTFTFLALLLVLVFRPKGMFPVRTE